MQYTQANPVVTAVKYRVVVGRVLQDLRKLRSLDQAGFASQAGISQPTLSRIESGTAGLTVDQLKRLGDVLGMTPSEILRRAEHAVAALSQRGVHVVLQEESSDQAMAFLGGAAVAALLALLAKK